MNKNMEKNLFILIYVIMFVSICGIIIYLFNNLQIVDLLFIKTGLEIKNENNVALLIVFIGLSLTLFLGFVYYITSCNGEKS